MNKTFNMRQILIIVATLAIGIFATTKVKATHLAAADLYITYVGAGADGCSGTSEYKYLVTLDVYRACERNSVGLGTSTSYRVASVNAGYNQTRPVNMPVIDTLDDLCAAFKPINSCRIPNNQQYPGFVRHRWTDTIILPSAQTDWTFSWTSGARNGGILNGSANRSIYIEAGLNNVYKYNNSTPRFLVSPLPYLCAGQPATYLNGPYDINGDSMYTVVQEPLNNNATSPIPYAPNPPYSINDPIGSTAGNPFAFNNTTATATFTPSQQGRYVMAFRCDEYERGTGEHLGYIMRDVQVSVFACSAPPPPVDPLPPTSTLKDINIVDIDGKKGLIACPGSNIEFSINTESPNATSNVFLEANVNVLPGSQFNTTGGGSNKVTGVFTWTPTTSDYGEHTLIITSKDSTCTGSGFSIVLKNYTVLLLKIVPGLDAGPDLPFCEINPDSVQLFAKGTDDISFTWSIANGGGTQGLSDPKIHNPKALPFETTDYVISTPDLVGACKSRDTVSVFKDETNKVVITPKNPVNEKDAMVLCRPGYVQLEALIAGRPPKNNVPCGTGSPTLCNNTFTSTIHGSTIYGSIGYDSIGANTPIMYNTLRTFKQQYLIRRSEITDADMFSATIRSMAFETKGTTTPTHIYSNFSISIKCTEKEQLSKADGFENFGMTQVYSTPSIMFEDKVHTFPFSTPYNWDTTKNLIVQICYGGNPTIDTGCGVTSSPPIIPYSPTTYVSGLSLPAANGTVQSVCGVSKDPAILELPARPVFTFTYCEADPLQFFITWNQGEYLSDSTITQPLAYVPKSGRYVVQTIGRSGCMMRDTLDIYVPNKEYSIVPNDTAICFGERTPISAYGGTLYKWYEYENGNYMDASGSLSCVDCPEPMFQPNKTTTYRLAVADSVFCFDTLEMHMEILPLPDVRILTQDDTTVRYGQRFPLLVSGARLYNWTPVSSLNNPNISYPIARPLDDTKYIVSGIGANGCKAYDTLHVTVDKRDRLNVPSAFSPNGDGKNDKFRVSNLTYQRILEFRVFNRWGQEVYSTNDATAGWDGTYGGKPQDIGAYSYMIRVSYPDGYVETYNGEVTLIR